ncbi:MAG: hypothetical protein ABIF10_06800 [Candidatus Woesearchaeota archaeon]
MVVGFPDNTACLLLAYDPDSYDKKFVYWRKAVNPGNVDCRPLFDIVHALAAAKKMEAVTYYAKHLSLPVLVAFHGRYKNEDSHEIGKLISTVDNLVDLYL